MTRKRAILFGSIVTAVTLALLLATLVINSRRAARRRPLPTPRTATEQIQTVDGVPLAQRPVNQWSGRIFALQRAAAWDQLGSELEALRNTKRAAYDANLLGYLHARVAIEAEEFDQASALLAPFLTKGHPLRELALPHAIEIEEGDENIDAASRLREALIFEFPTYEERESMIEEQMAMYDEKADAAGLTRFTQRLYASASSALRRDIDSRLVVSAAKNEKLSEAAVRAQRILTGSTKDDAADRVFRALDRADITNSLSPDLLLLLGEAGHDHRHFDRAVPLLAAARARLPQKFDELTFLIGRCHFGNEKYADAEKTYLAGAKQTKDMRWKATYFFHASRAAQLSGADDRALQLMTNAIAVRGKFPATSAALTQRMRTHLLKKNWRAAAADMASITKLFPNDHAITEASLAYASSLVAASRFADADRVLDSIPLALRDKYDKPEIDYWRGRSFEQRDVKRATDFYLAVLRADVPTHYAYFARERLSKPPLNQQVAAIVNEKKTAAQRAIVAKQWEEARRAQTDVVLLQPTPESLRQLRAIYEQLPAFQHVLGAKPDAMPVLPLKGDAGLGERLLAIGLFDEAVNTIKRRYPLKGTSETTLTQSLALNWAGASRDSILAIEIFMKGVPADFVPELLPRVVLELLYPRYFYDTIVEDSKRYEADPRLVVSIMREESRFNPRAKSVAAARGLLQFIITTARDVGESLGIVELEPTQLYDPRTIIRLGAKYIADLLETFERNPYQAAAAYNAGPNQTKLWKRMSPAAGNDYFLTAVNFEETKHYVRKVLNSYWRYGEIYENVHPPAGTRAEP